jgi:hypothetical protein
MSEDPSPRKGISQRAKWAILVTIMVSLVIYLGYLLKDFQQALHDVPN